MQFNMLKAQNEDSFGLDYVTVYNWGTYDKHPDTIRPELQHSWITGENRAGKSTVMDAVVTLLTPNRKRLYNAASGAEKSSERNERSYVKGAYNQGEEGDVKYLRPEEGEFSVLIGCFRTKLSNRVVCLAQVLWLNDEKVSKFFVVSEKALSIDQFKGATNISHLKKQLKSDSRVTTVYEQFSDYANGFMKLFGMRSAKALELFGVAVSLRDLENLGAFIRNSMLDRLDISAQANTVIELHRNSAETYKNILKAKDQIEVLRPIPDSLDTYKQSTQEIADIDTQTAVLKPYLSFKYIDVCNLKNEQLASEKQNYELKNNVLKQKKGELSDKIRSITEALSKDKGANQIANLETEIAGLETVGSTQKKAADLFDKDAAVLGLPGCETEAFFNETIQRSSQLYEKLPLEIENSRNELKQADFDCSKKSDELVLLKKELESLGKRDSNIPDKNAVIRSHIAQANGLNSNDLPFLGELIEVKRAEQSWEGALERLLHGSALNVLVEEKYYPDVTNFVKENHLRGKFTFIKVDSRGNLKVRAERDDNLRAFSKIEVKNGVFSTWLERHLRIIADHICCESSAELMAIDRGITREGLIRNDNERHIKDDRSSVTDRTNYILGWNTKLKREALILRIQTVASELSDLQRLSAACKIKLDQLNEKLSTAKTILRTQSFSEVSYKVTLSQIKAKKESLKILEEQNKNVKELRLQLDKMKSDLDAVKFQFEDISKKIVRIQYQMEELNKMIEQYRISYEAVSSDLVENMFPQLDIVADQIKLDLTKQELADSLNNMSVRLGELRKIKESFRSKAEKTLNQSMSKFKNLWKEESYELDSSIQFAEEFLAKFKILETEDLRKYESRFREMFTKKGLEAVILLEQSMIEKVDEIKDSIELINKPLKNTFYSPTTKISLHCKAIDNNRSVSDFQARLRKCTNRATDVFDSARQVEAFHAVNELVDYLTSKETESDRSKALDVRNWLEFYAVEVNAESGETVNYYWSSGGGSGGQKTKLTLTILASAMAYQFGLTEDAVSSDSFNFVMLDEAFARMDQKNSELVLSIFKEVGFQIMVASPPMYGFLVEPHIECFHFASINDEKSKSRIYTATKEQAEKHLGRKLQTHKSSQSGKATRLENHGRRQ